MGVMLIIGGKDKKIYNAFVCYDVNDKCYLVCLRDVESEDIIEVPILEGFDWNLDQAIDIERWIKDHDGEVEMALGRGIDDFKEILKRYKVKSRK